MAVAPATPYDSDGNSLLGGPVRWSSANNAVAAAEESSGERDRKVGRRREGHRRLRREAKRRIGDGHRRGSIHGGQRKQCTAGAAAAPTAAQTETAAGIERDFAAVSKRWNEIKSADIPALNAKLRAANLAEVRPEAKSESDPEPDQNADED